MIDLPRYCASRPPASPIGRRAFTEMDNVLFFQTSNLILRRVSHKRWSWSRRYPAYIFEITDSKIILRHDSPDHRCATLTKWRPLPVLLARSPPEINKFAQTTN